MCKNVQCILYFVFTPPLRDLCSGCYMAIRVRLKQGHRLHAFHLQVQGAAPFCGHTQQAPQEVPRRSRKGAWEPQPVSGDTASRG